LIDHLLKLLYANTDGERFFLGSEWPSLPFESCTSLGGLNKDIGLDDQRA